MFELFLPYLIGAALGMSPDAAPATAPKASSRAPEDQTPTGQFTTATEIKPILTATKGSWVAVRNYEGQDLLYVTQLLAWRCGLWDIRYGINGADPVETVPLEPCHDATNSPNALTDVAGYPPYVAFPENSIASVRILLTFDDGTTDTATYDRAAIQMP